jgi:uncharacterized RDD family membrane protein YckC
MKEIRNERAREAQGHRAGFVSQAIGSALDAASIFVIDFVLLGVFGFVRFLLTDKAYEYPQPGPALNFLIVFVTGTALLWSSWSGSGRAPGMAILGLRVVASSGGRLPSGRAFWRAVIGVLTLGLGIVVVLFSKRNKSLYDMLCGSAVVYDWRASKPAALPESRQNR